LAARGNDSTRIPAAYSGRDHAGRYRHARANGCSSYGNGHVYTYAHQYKHTSAYRYIDAYQYKYTRAHQHSYTHEYTPGHGPH
jgi:hypothetical protein